MNEKVIGECVICKINFVKNTVKRRGRRSRILSRGINDITCSKKCSNINRYKKRQRKKQKKKENKIREIMIEDQSI